VQFLKSLFCLQGVDNRPRFFAICCAVYVIFIMTISAFTGQPFISLTILALFTPVLAFTSLRRLKDARLNKKWLFVPTVIFILTSLIIIFSEVNSSYYLLLIPAVCFAVLLTYPSVRNKNSLPHNYVLGYFGPVDMSEYQQITHQGKQAKFRIEPTLVGNNSVDISNNEQASFQNYETNISGSDSQKQIDLGERVRLRLFGNKKIRLAVIIIFTIIFITILASSVAEFLSSNESIQAVEQAPHQETIPHNTLERMHPLSMPDNFTLFLSQHNGIIINWQADEVSTPLLWSQDSATGESSCQQISFNKGNSIRTLRVQVEQNIDTSKGAYNNYFATFSPLDSQALVQALAFRGSFSLCGYDFSLKGSQAALGTNKMYADWVEY